MMNNETIPPSHYEAAEALQDISNTRLETPVQKKQKKTPPTHDFSCDTAFVESGSNGVHGDGSMESENTHLSESSTVYEVQKSFLKQQRTIRPKKKSQNTTRVKMLQDKLKSVKSDFQAERKRSKEDLKQAMADLKKEKIALKKMHDNNAKLELQKEKQQCQNKALQSKNATEIKFLKGQLKACEKKVSGFDLDTCVEVQNEFNSIKKENNELKKERIELKKERNQLKREKLKLDKMNESLQKRFDKTNERLLKKIESLQKQIENFNENEKNRKHQIEMVHLKIQEKELVKRLRKESKEEEYMIKTRALKERQRTKDKSRQKRMRDEGKQREGRVNTATTMMDAAHSQNVLASYNNHDGAPPHPQYPYAKNNPWNTNGDTEFPAAAASRCGGDGDQMAPTLQDYLEYKQYMQYIQQCQQPQQQQGAYPNNCNQQNHTRFFEGTETPSK